ncbi:3578_t:CDS:2 [Gigaspora rosea]|nr:3578_t:CDS:2 [Gigaspora rosea]
MNKDQLRELLEGLTTSFAEVANTIANTKKNPEDKRELTHVKVEEELGNLSQKIEQIALNYAASTRTGPRHPPMTTIDAVVHVTKKGVGTTNRKSHGETGLRNPEETSPAFNVKN